MKSLQEDNYPRTSPASESTGAVSRGLRQITTRADRDRYHEKVAVVPALLLAHEGKRILSEPSKFQLIYNMFVEKQNSCESRVASGTGRRENRKLQ